jgi:hypothetical protein
MAAAAGVSGTRAWLNAHGFRWLTPKRLRALTIGLSIGALAMTSVGLSGSTPDDHHRGPAVAQGAR